MGLPAAHSASTTNSIGSGVGNQHRQPVAGMTAGEHARSIDRWQHYASCMPELMKLPAS